MIKIKFIVISLILVVLCCMCTEKGTEAPTTPLAYSNEAKIYTNLEYKFSFEYPKDWNIVEDQKGLVFVIYGPMVLEGIFTINMSLQTAELEEETTFANFVNISELEIRTRHPGGYKKVDEYDTTIGGQPARVITADFIIEHKGTKYNLKDTYALFIKDNIGYLMFYDVPAEFHDDYIDCFELVINSFKFE